MKITTADCKKAIIYNGDDEDGRQKLINLGLIEKELGFDMEF